MASSLPTCDICMADDTTKPASIWCAECEEAVCKDCEKQHSRMKLTKNHKTIPIEDYQELPGSVANIKQECKVHDRKLNFYCSIHNKPCCVSCISEKHSTCQTLKPLTEVVKGVKSSAAFEDLEDRATDISKLIGNLIKDKQDHKASVEFQKNKIMYQVQNARKTINIHLDKLETDLLDELDNKEKLQCKRIDSLIEKISKMYKNVNQIVNDLKRVKQHASDFQAFFGIPELNSKIEVHEQDWVSLQTDQIMSVFDIQFELSPILIKFDKDVKELGKLEVKCSTLKKILLRKEKQGQLFVPDSKTVDDIILTNIRSFQIPKGTSKDTFITGVDMFEDGRIVLADDERLNKRLVIMNQVGEYIKTVPLDDQCYDVAVIDKDTVATTLVFAKTVVIIDVNSSNVQRNIHTKDKCYGIISKGKQLMVSLYNKTIQFFDLSRNTFSTLSIAEISVHCSMLSDKLYYTTHNSDAVYSITLKGEVRWKFDLSEIRLSCWYNKRRIR